MEVFFVPAGGASVGGDHFIARFLVANALSGAPSPDQTGFFRYIVDPGDGTGIDLALTEMAGLATASELVLREGIYTRGVGLKRFNVPAGCTVRGSGAVSIISNAVDSCIFELAGGATLERMTLTSSQVGVGGTALVEAPAAGANRVTLRNLTISTGNFAVAGAQLTAGDFEIAGCIFASKAAQRGLVVEGAGASISQFDAHDCLFDGVSAAIRFGFTGGTSVRDSRIANNRFSLGNAVVPIQAGANSNNCVAMGNISRGSGSTLPTDAGTNNSINPGVANYWGP